MNANTYNSKFFNAEYFATERANARMMDTNIWQACEILGVDVNGARVSDVFHRLFNLYYEEEMAKA